MSPVVTTFLFEVANFLVLAAALGWLFFNPVRKALADRSARLAADEREATEKLAKAKRDEQVIASAKANLQGELNELRKRELTSARAEANQLLEATKLAADRELERSRRQAIQMSEAQLNRLSQAVAFAAAEVTGKLLEQLDGTALQTSLLNSACEQLRRLPSEHLSPVKVESARPLSPEEKSVLEGALDVDQIDYRVVDELGVGIRVSTARGLIDASASGLVSFARHALQTELHDLANHGLQQAVDDERGQLKAIADE